MNAKYMIIAAVAAMYSCSSANKTVDSISDVTLARYLDDKDAAISFTYDDGTLCHYEEVAPQLEKRGFRGTFWIIGDQIGNNDPGYPYMSWEQVADLSRRGHEMSNHSWTHPNLTELPIEQVKSEIERCDSALSASTGKKPVTFCYPYNAINDVVLATAAEGRVGTRTFWDAQGQEVSKCTDQSLSQWLDSIIDNKKWSVTMTHGLDYGWDKWDDPEVLWRLYDNVKSRESEVWVGTFAEVAAYHKERENTTLDVKKQSDGIIVTPSMNLDKALFTQPLTMVVKGDFKGFTPTATQDGRPLDVVNKGDMLIVNFMPGGGEIKIKF